MKTLFQYLFFVPVLFLSNCAGNAQNANSSQETAADRIEVLDFHTDHRCKTCMTIEKLTRAVLTESYAAQMENGAITFQLINVDKEENLPIAQKFGAFGTSLVLNVIQNGQEKQVDLTDFAFMNAGNEEKFTEGLKKHLETELESLQL